MGLIKEKTSLYTYKLFIGFINLYQNIISPVLPARCRYYPTCSNYGKDALAWHGVCSGSALLLRRLGRCHPWGGHGVDFVPVPLNRYYYKPVSAFDDFSDSHDSQRYLPKYSSSSVYSDNTSYVARLNYLLRQR